MDPLRSPQFAGGSISDQHVELSAEAIHIAASKGNLDILKDLVATWKGKLNGSVWCIWCSFCAGNQKTSEELRVVLPQMRKGASYVYIYIHIYIYIIVST